MATPGVMQIAPDGSFVHTIGLPPAREHTEIEIGVSIQGRRVTVQSAATYTSGFRAVSDAYVDGDGRLVVDVCNDYNFWRQHFTGESPRFQTYQARYVFLEQPDHKPVTGPFVG